eukprot:354430-Chlamydomonas_euryale.AAC.4
MKGVEGRSRLSASEQVGGGGARVRNKGRGGRVQPPLHPSPFLTPLFTHHTFQGQHVRALPLYRAAAALTPGSAAAWARLGTAARDAGRYGDGLDAFAAAVALDCGSDDAFAGMVVCMQVWEVREGPRACRCGRFGRGACMQVWEVWEGPRACRCGRSGRRACLQKVPVL